MKRMTKINKQNPALINRILIVGLGSIGKRHQRLAQQLLPEADIRILRHQVDGSLYVDSRAQFSSIEDAIAFAPQLAVICSPAPFHLASALPLAKAGIHLLVEKPLSTNMVDIKELLEVCRKKKIALLTGYNLRFLPSLIKFKELLDNRIIGRVYSVRSETGQYLPSWRPGIDYRQSVSASCKLGGGVLLELSHELDYLRWIFGEIGWVKASLSRQSDLEIDTEDTAHLTLGFIPALNERELICTLNIDFIRHDFTRTCIAIGERGSLRWNGLTGIIDFFERGAKDWRILFHLPHEQDDSYLAEWQNFLSCIHSGAPPLISIEDGIAVLSILEAARQSSSLGERTRVPKLEHGRDVING
jgi:predicted dehydrogenase